jgi:hypothetical protein
MRREAVLSDEQFKSNCILRNRSPNRDKDGDGNFAARSCMSKPKPKQKARSGKNFVKDRLQLSQNPIESEKIIQLSA